MGTSPLMVSPRQQWVLGLQRIGTDATAGGLGHWLNQQSDRLGAGLSSVGLALREVDTSGRLSSKPENVIAALSVGEPGPVRVWRLPFKPGAVQAVDRIVEIENQGGFHLKHMLPLNAHRWQGSETTSHTTDDLLLIFVKAPGTAGFRISADLCRDSREDLPAEVETPILGFKSRVPRMTRASENLDSLTGEAERGRFACPHSDAILSPSTFEYRDPKLSLLWQGEDDLRHIDSIQNSGKATWARMGRERDEDSLTWNLFRFLERREAGLAPGDSESRGMASLLLRGCEAIERSSRTRVYYWATDTDRQMRHPDLDWASDQVKESGQRTEPDVILDVVGGPLVFVEVKFMSSPYTTPTRPEVLPNYENHESFSRLFSASIQRICVENQCYQLMRLWQIGHLMAERLGKPFRLVSLVRAEAEPQLSALFPQFLTSPGGYSVLTWTQVHQELSTTSLGVDGQILARYLREKTAGYEPADGRQKLVRLITD